MAINKVVYGGTTLIDLTLDDITASDVLEGKYAHLPDGTRVEGTCTFDADTSDGTATAAEIISGKIAYVAGEKRTGTMPNRGGVTGNISTKAGQYSIQQGYHDGSGKVGIASAEQAKIIAGNIKSGISILGVTGTYTGEAITTQSKTVTPSASWGADQEIMPDAGYDYLSKVTVKKIPYVETDNAAGGKTVTIGVA